jgi:antitoxin component YwqK of YwqJK toxin-antitoxin module
MMNIKYPYSMLSVAAVLGLLAGGCRDNDKDDQVVSQRYIHKYGYTVSKEDWESKSYPGQIVTTMKNGVTVTATYENGVLHGPCTHTFPHSQTVETYTVYDKASPVREVRYDITGMPLQEKNQLSPSRHTLTYWYTDGVPLSIEEYVNEELLEGQYFSRQNEVESRVDKGNGVRLSRNQKGELLSKDTVESGYMSVRESFYASGSPESITHYHRGQLHGEKKSFAQNGEPLALEEWVNGKLHGKSTHFKNGSKYLELSYLDGLKYGSEIHYVDGDQISQEIHWENDRKHGPSNFYVESTPSDKSLGFRIKI